MEKEAEQKRLESGEFSLKALFKGGSKELQASELTVKV